MKKLLGLVLIVLCATTSTSALSDDVSPSAAPRGGDIGSCGEDNGGRGGGGGVLLSPLTILEVTAGVQYEATGGVKPYTWSISCESGSISSSGTITSLEGCCGAVSVSVKDDLGITKSLPIELVEPLLAVNGSETPIVNDPSAQYSASGGTPPYVWSFSGGSIDEMGKITAINGCSSPGSPRWTEVSVTDSCEWVASKEVRLPGGKWATGTCTNVAPYALCPNQVIAWPPGPPCYSIRIETSGAVRQKKYYSPNYGCTDNLNGTTSGDCSGEQIPYSNKSYFNGGSYADSGFTGNCWGVYNMFGHLVGWKRARLYAVIEEPWVCP